MNHDVDDDDIDDWWWLLICLLVLKVQISTWLISKYLTKKINKVWSPGDLIQKIKYFSTVNISHLIKNYVRY